MHTEIYYFSGTGNSLYMAKELQNRLPHSTLIPMASLMRQDVIATDGDTVGLVFPVHAMMLPLAVRRFLEKLDPRGASYVFAVTTHGGTLTLVDVALKRILNDKGSDLDAYFIQKMPWNSPIGLMPVYVPGMIHYPPGPERIETLTTAAKNRLDAIAGIVAEKVADPDDDSPHSLRLRLKRTACSLMDSADQSKVSNQIPFYAADGCTNVAPARASACRGGSTWTAGGPCGRRTFSVITATPVSPIAPRNRSCSRGDTTNGMADTRTRR